MPRPSRPTIVVTLFVCMILLGAGLWALGPSGTVSAVARAASPPAKALSAAPSSSIASSSTTTPSPARPPAPAPAPSPSAPSPLTERIDGLLSRWQADRAFWGLSILDLESGEVLYAHNADKAFLPASNQKLVTTAVALDALGSTYRYQTALRFSGTTTGGVMRGDLVIDGSGDPTFGSVELRGRDPLADWAERLAEMGVTRIEGRLIGDDNRFDNRPYPEGWDVDYITRQAGRYMGTSAGGLSYNDNVVAVKVGASRPGAPPTVQIRPQGAVAVQNQARTSSRWRGSSLQVDRTFSTNQLVLTGSVPRSYRGTVNVPVSNPTTFTLQAFSVALDEAGIETDLEIVDVDALDTRPNEGDPLFVTLSPPLSEILAVVNKRSNNFYAEQVFRTFGWGGSTRGASKRTKSFLRRTGVDTRRILVSDGSGLSRKDLITPEAMVTLLAHMYDHDERNAYLASLPQGGENNTTLEYRLHRAPVQAKTGSLRFVRALSGYARRPDGRRVAFAFFANNYTGPSYQISRTIDDVVRTLTSTTME